MILKRAMRLAAVGLCCGMFGIANAADPLPATTQLVAASNAAAPVQESFTITTAQDLVVTLTDLQIPAALVSAGVVVTQAGAIAGSGQLAAPATNASVSLPAASGLYTLYVFGVPNSSYSVGTFSVCVAPKASPSNCIQTVTVPGVTQPEVVSFSGNITAANSSKDPTVSTLSTTLTVTTAGAYTFNFADLAFPVALNAATSPNPTLALFQGSTPIIPPNQTSPGIISGTSLNLSPGQYTLLAIAQADPTVQQGLYSIVIAGPSGTNPLYSAAVPVGLLNPGTTCYNPSSQSATLTVTDYVFPGPAALASASAIVTSGGAMIGTANSAGGAQTLTVPAGNLTLWTYGSMGANAGTFSADVSAGGSDLCLTAQGVGPSAGSTSSTYAYAYVAPTPTVTMTSGVPITSYNPLAAGAYTATAADLQFPAQLTSLGFAVAQHGQVLQQSSTATTLNVTAAAGNAIVLASAVAPTSTGSAGGLFDVNLQATGTTASLAFDKAQSVSSTPGLFNTQTITVADNASYDVSLTDLKFPAAFDSLALVVSRGSQVLGKAFGSAPVSFSGSPGTYLLTFVATPSSDQQFGLYSESVVYSPPTVTLTSSASTVTAGTAITLSSSSTNATSCAATGGWTGTIPVTATTTSETPSATTTYTLTCTGTGGSATQSVTVTVTPAPAKSGGGGGGGSMDPALLLAAGALLGARYKRLKSRAHDALQ